VNDIVAAGTEGEVKVPTQEDLNKLWTEVAADRGKDPAAAPVVTPEATPAEPAEAAPIELPDELKEALAKVDSLKTLVDNLSHRVQSSDGRVGALQRELQQARAATATSQRAPNEQTVRAAAKTPEKWAKLKEEFPEWGEAVESLVDATRAEQPQVDLTPLQTEIQNQINGIVQQFHWAVEEAKLFGAYKNYKTTVNSTDFVDWWKQQPGDIQSLTASRSSEDAIRALDLFSEHQRKVADSKRDTTQERSARLQAAVARPRGQATPPKDDRELTAAEVWAAEAAQREQKRANRF